MSDSLFVGMDGDVSGQLTSQQAKFKQVSDMLLLSLDSSSSSDVRGDCFLVLCDAQLVL